MVVNLVTQSFSRDNDKNYARGAATKTLVRGCAEDAALSGRVRFAFVAVTVTAT